MSAIDHRLYHSPLDPDPSEDISDGCCGPNVSSSELVNILRRVLRVYEKGKRKAEETLAKTEHLPDAPNLEELAAYAQSLITTSSSINRILYQLETASHLDMVALISGRYRGLANKADPTERQAVYNSIQIRKHEDLVMVRLPYLPGRKQTARQFVFDLLFQRLINEGPYPQWNRVHILFTHVYPTTLQTMPKDVDNFVYKPAIDFLAAAMSFSDSAWTCSLEQRAEFRDDLKTGVYIQVSPMSWNSTLDKWQELSATPDANAECEPR